MAKHRFPSFDFLMRKPWQKRKAIVPNLAVNQTTTIRWSLEEDLAGYVAAGVSSIGLWRTKLIDYSDDRVAELVLDSGLSVSSISYAGGFTAADGTGFDEAVEETHELIRFAGSVGARNLRVFSGGQGGHIRSHARRLVYEGLAHCADYAQDFDVTLVLQPMSHRVPMEQSFVHSLDEALAIVEQCDHPNVALALNTYQLRETVGLVERIPSLVPQLGAVIPL